MGKLSAPHSRAQGWFFTSEVTREKKEQINQVRVIMHEEDPTEVITIRKHERRASKLEGDRIMGVRSWTMATAEPKAQERADTGKGDTGETEEAEKSQKEKEERLKEKEKKEANGINEKNQIQKGKGNSKGS